MTWKLVAAAVALSLAIGAGCRPRQPGMGQTPVFPKEANGWLTAGKTQTFGRNTIFTYMNGAGELYLAYDFRRISVQEYTRPDAPRIVAEAYEMSTSEDAYGVFSHDPEGEDVGIGQGNAYGAGLLRFWKGAWCFRILAERETPGARAAVLAIGRALAAPIEDGPLPPVLRRLPADGLDPAGVRYFHTHFSLTSIHYLADDNILDLSPRTEAALGAYRRGGEKLLLLVIRYKSPRQAEAAYREFNRVYLKDQPPPAGPRRIVPVEQGRHLGVLLRKHFVAIVLDAKSRAACERLLGEAAERLD